jgi:hypothetical protein
MRHPLAIWADLRVHDTLPLLARDRWRRISRHGYSPHFCVRITTLRILLISSALPKMLVLMLLPPLRLLLSRISSVLVSSSVSAGELGSCISERFSRTPNAFQIPLELL